MKLHAVCFSIRVVPFSTKPESHIVTLPTEGFEKPEDAWGFLKMALAEFLPKTLELEETMTLYEEDVGDQGFFFSVEGRSWGRSVETINFYLAIRRAGYPIVIRDGKKLAPRLTGAERIGVVPDGVFPCYCESSFNDDSIIDYINLPHTDREIWAKHCVWFSEPELRLL